LARTPYPGGFFGRGGFAVLCGLLWILYSSKLVAYVSQRRRPYGLAIDGMTCAYRDCNDLAIEAAPYLKTKSLHAEVTLR